MRTSTTKRNLAAALLIALFLPITANAQETGVKTRDLFTIDDMVFHGGFSVGWVAKEWSTSANGRTYHEDLWGNPGKMLHGVQFGLHFNQSIYYGVGWRTGLYYEWYISHDQFLKDIGWDRFNEHCLYIPMHVQFRLPLSRYHESICITPYAGIGFNIAMKGRMKNGPKTGASGKEVIGGRSGYHNTGNFIGDIIASIVDDATSHKEYIQHEVQNYVYDDYTPRKFNLQAEFGVALRIYAAQLTFTYSMGLTRHHLYDDASSRQNKFAVNLGLTF